MTTFRDTDTGRLYTGKRAGWYWHLSSLEDADHLFDEYYRVHIWLMWLSGFRRVG